MVTPRGPYLMPQNQTLKAVKVAKFCVYILSQLEKTECELKPRFVLDESRTEEARDLGLGRGEGSLARQAPNRQLARQLPIWLPLLQVSLTPGHPSYLVAVAAVLPFSRRQAYLSYPLRPRTSLEMSPCGFWVLPAALLALLCCPGSGEKAPPQSKQMAVKNGDPFKVNCTSDCPNPVIKGLETPLHKNVLQEQAQWIEYLVVNISQDTVLYCYSTCSGKQTRKTIYVHVFHPPAQVLLRLQPARVTVGGSFTIVCSVPAATPLKNLTLTLLHGEKPLHIQTFENGTDAPATATHNATAHKEDDHHNFSCRAELDLRSLGRGIISKVSEVQVLQVYAVAPETDRDLQGARSLEDPQADLPDPTYMSGVSTTTAASGAPRGSSPALAEGLWQAAGLLGIFPFLM